MSSVTFPLQAVKLKALKLLTGLRTSYLTRA